MRRLPSLFPASPGFLPAVQAAHSFLDAPREAELRFVIKIS
jgi:hypothetical protein